VPLTLSSASTLLSPRDAVADLRMPAIDAPVDRTRTTLAPRRPATADPVVGVPDVVDEWGMQSFPASDPPSNW
jgi:hypothetical protein